MSTITRLAMFRVKASAFTSGITGGVVRVVGVCFTTGCGLFITGCVLRFYCLKEHPLQYRNGVPGCPCAGLSPAAETPVLPGLVQIGFFVH